MKKKNRPFSPGTLLTHVFHLFEYPSAESQAPDGLFPYTFFRFSRETPSSSSPTTRGYRFGGIPSSSARLDERSPRLIVSRLSPGMFQSVGTPAVFRQVQYPYISTRGVR